MLTTTFDTIKEFPTTSFFVMILMFAWLGFLIVTRYLMQKQIRNFLPKIIFIITFACSVSLLAMYLYEISLIHMSETFWDILLSVLVIMCTVVIPLVLLMRLPYVTYRIPLCSQKTRIPIIAIIIVVLYLKLLSIWSTQIKKAKKLQDQIGIFTKQHINILIEILVNYGVVIMALMSAYGAVWCPYIYFNHTESKRDDLVEAKKKTKEEIFFIIEQIKKNKHKILVIEEKRAKLQKMREQEQIKKAKQNENKKSSAFSFVKGIKSFFTDSHENQKEIQSLNQKIAFHKNQLQTLQRVHMESFSVYRQIVDEERKHLISDTLMGKIFRLFSFVLTVYSISRFILTAWNMIKGRKLSTDPITRFLNFIVWMLDENVNDTFRTYSQYISFGFMGYLMISSVRSFSMNIKNFFDFVLRRRRLNLMTTDTLVLLLSQMYGIYFLSAVILLQSSLPRTYVTNFEHIVGTVRLVEHFTFFDKLFFWFCNLSVGFIFICERQRKQKMKVIIKERNFVSLSD